MEALREHLGKLSPSIESLSSPPKPTRLATLGQTHLAVLHSSPPTLLLLPLTPSHRASTHEVPSDADTLHARDDTLAVIGPRSVTVVHAASPPTQHPVAAPLLRARPSLNILHAAWSPHAGAFLAVLTSDSCLRLFDVLAPAGAATERWRLPLVTAGAAPVSFAFGRGRHWHSLSVYVLCEDGAVYVAAPVAPIGTSLEPRIWRRMRAAAQAVITRAPVSDPDHDRRASDGSAPTVWPERQAAMQLRFLDAFEASGTRMICMREFKPAPLLLQGPLFVEHDDSAEDLRYCQLAVVACGASAPPVLLRVSEAGDVSVLVQLESLEPQWFLSTDIDSTGGSEYANTALAVAPALLAFERLSFPNPVRLFPLSSNPDADVLFAATDRGVFSIRLSFISVINNADALERTPHTTISQILTTCTSDNSGHTIHGLTPSYARNEGPVAIVLTSDGELHATPPIKWVSDFDLSLPPRLLSAPESDSTWEMARPQRGTRAFACPDAGKDVAELLHTAKTLQGQHCSPVAPGTLGVINPHEQMSSAIAFLEDRVASLTGGNNNAGIVDNLNNLASVVTQWSDELDEHVSSHVDEVRDVRDILRKVETSEDALKLKLSRVEELARLLAERMRTVTETLQSDSSQLSPAELERYARLKEKKRRMTALRNRIKEIGAAVEARKAPFEDAPASGFYSPIRANYRASVRSPASTPRRPSRRSGTPSWRSREEPLARRRPEWSPAKDKASFSRTELQQIKSSLEDHSREISEAMELSSSLWKRLSAV